MVDWEPVIRAVLNDRTNGVPPGFISGRFHRGLATAVREVARRVGCRRVVLSGGCFQNRVLLEQTVSALREAEFEVFWHQRVPPNDGGISLGQVVAARRQNV